jgi:hypothetical protein
LWQFGSLAVWRKRPIILIFYQQIVFPQKKGDIVILAFWPFGNLCKSAKVQNVVNDLQLIASFYPNKSFSLKKRRNNRFVLLAIWRIRPVVDPFTTKEQRHEGTQSVAYKPFNFLRESFVRGVAQSVLLRRAQVAVTRLANCWSCDM